MSDQINRPNVKISKILDDVHFYFERCQQAEMTIHFLRECLENIYATATMAQDADWRRATYRISETSEMGLNAEERYLDSKLESDRKRLLRMLPGCEHLARELIDDMRE